MTTSTNHRSSSHRSDYDAETGRIVTSPRSENEKEKKAQLCHELDVNGLDGTRGSSIVKNTEKEVLGIMLGNVDVPVEGFEKAGIWVLD